MKALVSEKLSVVELAGDPSALGVGPGAPAWALAFAGAVSADPVARWKPLSESELLQALDALPNQSAAEVIRTAKLDSGLSSLLLEPLVADSAALAEDDAPVISMVNAVLREAAKRNASDIHFEPYELHATIRLRIDGMLVDLVQPPRAVYSALVSRIKIMSQLDIAERRLPQDGRLSISLDSGSVDVRVSVLPTAHGERVVLRLLQKNAQHLQIQNLGMSAEVEQKFSALLEKPNGIVLVTGPTGSGKTTTLYAALMRLRTSAENIMTVEDPVEYNIEGISQTPVSPKIGLSFASALRAILRQDPDILMVGEIRDLETAQIAVQAALTGHLVLATLHTNDSASAVTRLIDMGIEPFLLSSTLRGVLAQRLLRRLCSACDAKNQDCEICNGTGYSGRLGIYELMVVNEPLQEAIRRGDDATQIRTIAAGSGLIELRQDANRWLAAGQTSAEEVARVIAFEASA